MGVCASVCVYMCVCVCACMYVCVGVLRMLHDRLLVLSFLQILVLPASLSNWQAQIMHAVFQVFDDPDAWALLFRCLRESPSTAAANASKIYMVLEISHKYNVQVRFACSLVY